GHNPHSLDDITNTFNLAELIPPKQINMHINALLHRRNLLVDPTNIQERLYIASAQDSGESFAEGGKACYASSHLHHSSEKEYQGFSMLLRTSHTPTRTSDTGPLRASGR